MSLNIWKRNMVHVNMFYTRQDNRNYTNVICNQWIHCKTCLKMNHKAGDIEVFCLFILMTQHVICMIPAISQMSIGSFHLDSLFAQIKQTHVIPGKCEIGICLCYLIYIALHRRWSI